MRVWGATPNPHIFWHRAVRTHPYSVSKNTVAGAFGAEICVFGAPRQNPKTFGIVHFKHTHTMYPKTLLPAHLVQRYVRLGRHVRTVQFLALCISSTPIQGIQKHCCWHVLVQRYVCLGRHVKTPQFLALCMSNTHLLGIQKHCCWHICCTGMCVWGATSEPYLVWHCSFQTHPYKVSKNTVAGVFGAEVRVFGAPRQNPTIFGIVHFKHIHTGFPKTLLLACFGAEVCAFGAPPKKPTIFGIVHFKHTHTRYPKTRLLAYLVQRYACLGRHVRTLQFLALPISNTSIPAQYANFAEYAIFAQATLNQ